MKRALPPLILMLSWSLFASAQQTYNAPTGTVGSTNIVQATLDGGGSVKASEYLGNCYFGQVCGFTNGTLSYLLPDGSTATLTNFAGTGDFSNQNDIVIKGSASGTDNAGKTVTASAEFTFKAFCRSGRGGGCTRTYLGGSLTINYN